MPSASPSADEERAARALYDALKAADPTGYYGHFRTDERVTIDGVFDLVLLARALGLRAPKRSSRGAYTKQ